MRPSLVEKFTSVAQISAQMLKEKILDMWEIIKYMSNVWPIPKSHDPIKHRFQSEPVDQAKKYLEKHAMGDPSNYKLVESFVGLRFRNSKEEMLKMAKSAPK
jgi:hypothetical protein